MTMPGEQFLVNSENISVAEFLKNMHDIIDIAHKNLELSQQKYKKQVDRHRKSHELVEGSQVYLRIHFGRYKSLEDHTLFEKLAPRFYGPFTILRKISTVSYELKLPNNSKIHPIFHVSLLKSALGT